MDNLETHETRRVLPGGCFSVEPGIYQAEFGVRSEVDVYVDQQGKVHVTAGELQRHVFPILKHTTITTTGAVDAHGIDPAHTRMLATQQSTRRMRRLLEVIRDTPIDLVVMTPRSRAKFSRRLVGDVLGRLLEAADCPVLLLR